MKKVSFNLVILLTFGLLCACSNSDEGFISNEIKNHLYSGDGSYGESASDKQGFSLGDMNVLQIESENGDTETCMLSTPSGSLTSGLEVKTDPDGGTHTVYQLGFTAIILNSSLFNILDIKIESDIAGKASELKVGDSFNSNAIHVEAWDINIPSLKGRLDYALGGQIKVVEQRTDENGRPHITLSLQDLKFHSYDQECFFTLNGLIDYDITGDDVSTAPNTNQPEPNVGEFDMETGLIPNEYLISFMMDALYKDKFQGRRTFFGEGPEEQECLIINSEEEFREAYKGDKVVPNPIINFNYCTLVIGRTYGENGCVSLGDYELIDNGDTYQLNMTLNNNVNPNITYTADFTDLYFWKIYPKMENKPVVFNRILQDVNIDPFGDGSSYAKLRKRWLLQSYIDSNGILHQVDDVWGDERYCIEFKEEGRMEGHINANEFAGYYTIPYSFTIDGGYEGYHGDYTFGLINMTDVNSTMVYDSEPLSEEFMRVFNATEFKLWSSDIMTIKVSENEVFGFFRENIKEIYGYK